MRLFLLSLLAVGSVQSHAIGSTGATGYAYPSVLLAYSPARSEYPVDYTLAKGFLRYIDVSGTQSANVYSYAEPAKAVGRQVYIAQGDNELFGNWCAQRVQDLQAEVEKLQSTGMVPPQELVGQLQLLQEILSTTNTVTSETAEKQSAKAEQLGIWNEARLREIYAQQLKPLVIPDIQLRSATVDDKKTVQLQNEKLVLEKAQNAAEPVVRTEFQPIFQTPQVRLSPSGFVLDTPEVMQAREEHFRLYNEAKLRTEKAGYESDVKQAEAGNKPATENSIAPSTKAQNEVLQNEQQLAAVPETILSAQASPNFLQEHPLGVPFQQLAVGLRSVAGFDAPTEQQLRAIEDTLEVKRAREEHLKLKKQQEEAIAMLSNTEPVQTNTKAETVLQTVAQTEKFLTQQPIQAEIPLPASSQTLSAASQLSIGLRTGAQSEQALTVPKLLGKIEEEVAMLNTANSEYSKTTPSVEKENVAGALQQDEIEEILMNIERLRKGIRYCKDERKIYAQSLVNACRMVKDELLKVRQDEEEIKQYERLEAEKQRLKDEEALLKATEKPENIEKLYPTKNSEITGEIRRDDQQTPALQARFSQNPYLVQFVSPQGVGSDILIGAQQPATQQVYKIPAATASLKSQVLLNQANPFLQTYTLKNRPELLKEQLESAKLLASPILFEQQVGSMPVADNAEQQQAVESPTAALSELERATREHFRAHEIALEQLRLAKLRNPDYKDNN